MLIGSVEVTLLVLLAILDIVGTWLLVPAFLVSIGLNIDPRLMFRVDTLLLAGLFTSFVVVGKTSAAIITGLGFGFRWSEIGAMSCLSFGQSASTLAIAEVGLELEMFDERVVNAAVLTIVATAFLTSYGTALFIRRVPRPVSPPARIGESVLVDIRSLGSDLGSLMMFAGSLANRITGS